MNKKERAEKRLPKSVASYSELGKKGGNATKAKLKLLKERAEAYDRLTKGEQAQP